MKDIIIFLSGILTPVIAALAVIIANNQWRVQRYKLKYDLYDRRFKIFEEIKRHLIWIGINEKRSSGKAFSYSIIEYKFLFNKDINNFIDELVEKTEEFDKLGLELMNFSRAQENKVLYDKRDEIKHWAIQEVIKLPERFEKYLSFKHLK